MTTTPAAISPRHADDDGPAQNADRSDPTGFRILPSRLGRSFIPVTDRHRRLISGFDPEAYDRTSRDLRRLRVPGLTVSGDGRSYRLGDRRHRGDR